MKDKIKDSIYNRMFEFLMKHRAADVIRAVNASSTAIQREQKAKHILDWYINNAGEMEPLTDEQLAAVKDLEGYLGHGRCEARVGADIHKQDR